MEQIMQTTEQAFDYVYDHPILLYAVLIICGLFIALVTGLSLFILIGEAYDASKDWLVRVGTKLHIIRVYEEDDDEEVPSEEH